MYSCDKCKYETDIKCNWNKHIVSKKHMKNSFAKELVDIDKTINVIPPIVDNVDTDTSNDMFKCEFCSTECSTKKILVKHKKNYCKVLKTCDDMPTIYVSRIGELYLENEKLKAENDKLKQNLYVTHEKLDKTNDKLVSIAENAVSTNKTSVTTMSNCLGYLTQNHSKAKPLLELTFGSVEQIFDNEKNTYAYVKNFKEDLQIGLTKDDALAEIIIKKYSEGVLSKYIATIIGRYYKTKNPKDQSFWNTDSSRLNYIIMDIVEKEKKWITDKKGTKVKQRIISPIMLKIKEIIQNYNINTDNIINKIDLSTLQKRTKLMYKGTMLIASINEEKQDGKILDEMSSMFHLDKSIYTPYDIEDMEENDSDVDFG
jgi:hypothetical protein